MLPILALLLLAQAARAETHHVTVRDFDFDPQVVDIQVGDTVVWTNVSGVHNVASDDGTTFSSEAKGAPWTFSHTFTAAGTVPYHCDVHLFMTGTVNVAAAPSECVPSATTLCLNNGRFEVRTHWRSASQSGDATAVPLDFAPDSGLFYFFSPTNIEMLVKVLNACVPALGNKYWVFFAATTDVELTVTVTDTQTGTSKVYTNPLGKAAAPVQDTNAFPTCP
jgi:plastocyanin